MLLEKEIIEKINNYVREEPRTIQEIAELIGKSWRTADRYTREISEKEGTLKIKTFRGGTRGALKIVYWNSIDQINTSLFQERLFRKIEMGKDKTDFSPFNIYQCAEKRYAFLEQQEDENVNANHNIIGTLREAERELRRVLSEIARKYDIVEIVFEHRLSPASPGERIVQIAIAARDRRSALKALEEIVKAFKSSPHIRRRDIYAEE